MEDIYTIKVRTNSDPRDLYPSERRYSASTVLGLAVVHLALAVTTLLLASLNLTTHKALSTNIIPNYGIYTPETENLTDYERNDDVAFLDEDTEPPIDNFDEYESDLFVNLTLIPCLMSLGALAAGLTGLLAWKRWYVDQNIKWFFVMSSLATLTSLACLTSVSLAVGSVADQQNNALLMSNNVENGNAFIFSFSNDNLVVDRIKPNASNENVLGKNVKTPNLRVVIAINILIAAVLEFLWAILSTKISWKGMRNDYPDDIMVSHGKVEVNTVHKGNKHKGIAPDILNHHPTKRKFAKYFPKKQDQNLPNTESNAEYRERVNKFLSSNNSD